MNLYMAHADMQVPGKISFVQIFSQLSRFITLLAPLLCCQQLRESKNTTEKGKKSQGRENLEQQLTSSIDLSVTLASYTLEASSCTLAPSSAAALSSAS